MDNGFRRLATTAGALLIAGGISTAAFAQDNSLVQGDASITIDTMSQVIDDEATEEAVKSAAQRDTGWYPKLRIGGSAALNYNKDVDGVNDGTALTFGVYLKGALDAVYKNFEWQNKLDIEHQQTKTPTLDDFIKTTDKLDFQTLLLFRIPGAEWLGPFARGRLQTSILPGYYMTDEDITVRFFENGSDIDDKANAKQVKAAKELKAQESVKLSSAFEPLIISEAAGLFINPYSSEMLTVSFKVGAAGQHLIAYDDGFVSFDDDDDDAFYDVIQLKDTHSVGIEGELELSGVFTGYVNWSLSGSLYYPFEINDDQGLKDEELIHADIEARISVRLASWASLDYSLSAKRLPFITTDWQINNTLLFNVGFDVFK